MTAWRASRRIKLLLLGNLRSIAPEQTQGLPSLRPRPLFCQQAFVGHPPPAFGRLAFPSVGLAAWRGDGKLVWRWQIDGEGLQSIFPFLPEHSLCDQALCK